VFVPAGFGSPELSGALTAGFVAKEIVVSTMRQTIGGSPAEDTGSDESGSDESGSDESGSDESGSDESGSDEAGSDESGPGFVRGLADVGGGSPGQGSSAAWLMSAAGWSAPSGTRCSPCRASSACNSAARPTRT